MKPLGTQMIAEFSACSGSLLADQAGLEKVFREAIETNGFTLISINSYRFDTGGVSVIAIIGESHMAVHTYPADQHASLDIFTCSNPEGLVDLLGFMRVRLQAQTFFFKELQRGNPLEVKEAECLTGFSPYGFEIRYHIGNHLVSKESGFQYIDVIENKSFGRMLFLDKDIQVTERDADLYSSQMLLPLTRQETFPGKVAILGGGDGAILNRILRHPVGEVVLIDIDATVIEVAREYLTPVCGDAFADDRVTVVNDDVRRHLQYCRNFDAIIYDLTMHPEAFTRYERSTFFNTVFFLINQSLKSEGIVSLQCSSEFDTETLALLDNILPKYFDCITYYKVYIPSFCERWVFASAVNRTQRNSAKGKQ